MLPRWLARVGCFDGISGVSICHAIPLRVHFVTGWQKLWVFMIRLMYYARDRKQSAPKATRCHLYSLEWESLDQHALEA
jgi:hypothetical protein